MYFCMMLNLIYIFFTTFLFLAHSLGANIDQNPRCPGPFILAKPDDTCLSLATRGGISVQELQKLNRLDCFHFNALDRFCYKVEEKPERWVTITSTERAPAPTETATMTAINTRTVAVLSSTDTLGVPMETLVNQALSIRSFCLSGLTVLPWCLATTFML